MFLIPLEIEGCGQITISSTLVDLKEGEVDYILKDGEEDCIRTACVVSASLLSKHINLICVSSD